MKVYLVVGHTDNNYSEVIHIFSNKNDALEDIMINKKEKIFDAISIEEMILDGNYKPKMIYWSLRKEGFKVHKGFKKK